MTILTGQVPDGSRPRQSTAWAMAKKLIAVGIKVEMKITDDPGTDWADVFLKLQEKYT